MNTKKILMIAGVFPPGIGGMQSYYYNLCKHSRHEVSVIAPHYAGDAEFDRKQSFKIVRKPVFPGEKVTFFGILKLIGYTFAAIWREKPNVTVYGYIAMGFIGWALSFFTRHCYTVSIHGKDILETMRVPVLRTLLRWMLKRASGVMANSRYTQSVIMELGIPESHIEVIYPGVEPHFEKRSKDPGLMRRYGLEDKPVIATISRLVKRKGHDMVIRALPLIQRSIPEIRYVIVGNGPERNNLERLARETWVSDAVVFTGSVDRETAIDFHNIADVFIMPSRYLNQGDVEGFGIVYLEAASCGKPAIGGNSGGVVEAILHGETGLLVDSESVEAIAEAVVRTIENPDWARKLAEQGYRRAKGEFQYTEITQGFDKYLSSLT